MKIKKILSAMIIGSVIAGSALSASAEDNLVKSDVEAYQGIFMKNDIFISLPLYGYVEPNEPIGIVYQISRPYKYNNSINQDTIKTLGDIYEESDNIYYIKNNDFKMSLCYKNGKIILKNIAGASAYEGEYIQISNAGANTNPNNVWLDIPENSDYSSSTNFSSSGSSSGNTSQSGSKGTITVTKNLDIKIDRDSVYFSDAKPFIDSAGRTQVPVRFVAEQLGYEVEWEKPSNIDNIPQGGVAIRGDNIPIKWDGETVYRSLFLAIGSNWIGIFDFETSGGSGYGSSYNIYMDTEAMIKNGRTYIPLRYVAELLGYNVLWQ